MQNNTLQQTLYTVIGCCHEVYRQLGPGLPEYVYQEALASEFTSSGLTFYKELEFHPLYKGNPLNTYIKMDLVVESIEGNIIIECKALSNLTEREHYQVFGYLRATGFSAAVLVNFGASPKAQIERFTIQNSKIVAFW